MAKKYTEMWGAKVQGTAHKINNWFNHNVNAFAADQQPLEYARLFTTLPYYIIPTKHEAMQRNYVILYGIFVVAAIVVYRLDFSVCVYIYITSAYASTTTGWIGNFCNLQTI